MDFGLAPRRRITSVRCVSSPRIGPVPRCGNMPVEMVEEVAGSSMGRFVLKGAAEIGLSGRAIPASEMDEGQVVVNRRGACAPF